MKLLGKIWICSWVCLLATTAFGGDGIASFAKQSLGIDLASIPFGMSVQTNGEYVPVEAPPLLGALTNATDFHWMTNGLSAKYNHDFPNRNLRYGFRGGRLVAIVIFMEAMTREEVPLWVEGTPNQKKEIRQIIEQRHNELSQIHDDLVKTGPGKTTNFDDGSFRIQCTWACGLSIDVAETIIMPTELKRTP